MAPNQIVRFAFRLSQSLVKDEGIEFVESRSPESSAKTGRERSKLADWGRALESAALGMIIR